MPVVTRLQYGMATSDIATKRPQPGCSHPVIARRGAIARQHWEAGVLVTGRWRFPTLAVACSHLSNDTCSSSGKSNARNDGSWRCRDPIYPEVPGEAACTIRRFHEGFAAGRFRRIRPSARAFCPDAKSRCTIYSWRPDVLQQSWARGFTPIGNGESAELWAKCALMLF